MKKARKKTLLVKQFEKLFSYPYSDPVGIPEPNPSYPGEPRTVQSFTTYSACEDPIPNPRKQP